MIKFVKDKYFSFTGEEHTGYVDQDDNLMEYDLDTPKNRADAIETLESLHECKRTINCSNLSNSTDCHACQDSYNLVNCDSVYKSSFCQDSSDLDKCHHCINSDYLIQCEHVFRGKHCHEVKHGYNIVNCSSSKHLYNCTNVWLSSYVFNERDKCDIQGFKLNDELESFMEDIRG